MLDRLLAQALTASQRCVIPTALAQPRRVKKAEVEVTRRSSSCLLSLSLNLNLPTAWQLT